MIGIIGGTFDPINYGHLRPALEIAEQLSLDEMRFIPSANPPHRWQPEASAEHRLAMVKLAIEGVDNFVIDEREYHREGASFTVDTLASIRAEIGDKEPICMLIGMDAFEHFTKWKNWQKILDLTHLVVSSRPGYNKIEILDWMKARVTKSVDVLYKTPNGKLFFADVSQFDLSATFIRKQYIKGKSLRYALPDNVGEYIKQNKLYTQK